MRSTQTSDQWVSGALSLTVKHLRHNHSPHLVLSLKNEWRFNSIPSYAFMTCIYKTSLYFTMVLHTADNPIKPGVTQSLTYFSCCKDLIIMQDPMTVSKLRLWQISGREKCMDSLHSEGLTCINRHNFSMCLSTQHKRQIELILKVWHIITVHGFS